MQCFLSATTCFSFLSSAAPSPLTLFLSSSMGSPQAAVSLRDTCSGLGFPWATSPSWGVTSSTTQYLLLFWPCSLSLSAFAKLFKICFHKGITDSSGRFRAPPPGCGAWLCPVVGSLEPPGNSCGCHRPLRPCLTRQPHRPLLPTPCHACPK